MKCILCNGSNINTLFTGHDLLIGVEGEFSIIQCGTCGLAWVNPCLKHEELTKYYPQDYISFQKAPQDEKNRLRQRIRQYGYDKRADQVIARVKNPGKVLDVGCATGLFLNAMQQRGWECYGVEPSDHAASYAVTRFGLNVFKGVLEESPYPASSFDVVTMWDVLEHVPNPNEMLAKVHHILKPGGLIIISMPNMASVERKVFGKYWAGWDIPRHFFIYDINTITRLLSQEKFNVEGVSSFMGGHGVLILSIQFWMNSFALPAWLKKSIAFLMQSTAARIVTYPYYQLAGLLNISSTMVVFARKKA